MSETRPPIDPPNSSEIPLEDIDKLLESEDPDFAKSLEEVRNVESDKTTVIDASAIDESLVGDELADPEKTLSFVAKVKFKLRKKVAHLKITFKTKARTAGKDFVQFLKVLPKQFALSAVKILVEAGKNAAIPIRAFQQANKTQRIAVLLVTALALGSFWVLLANFKGIWLPNINEPLLSSFENVADRVETYNPKEGGESFYSAFPQERHELLFPKMKVNLRRTADNPNPMGAFEVIVLLDSKDTAIEVSDRQIEFFDLMQRTLEEESFNDLESELGKSRLKSHLKRELSQKLTQGWAKDISFKTFILKP